MGQRYFKMTFDTCLSCHLLRLLNTLQEKQCLTHHLSELISSPTLLFKTKRKIPSFHWNIKDTVTEHKITKAEVFQNLTWISNVNKCNNILFEAVFHRCWGVFQVLLFVAQIISVAKSTLELHRANMKGGYSATERMTSTYWVLKRVLLPGTLLALGSFSFFFSQKPRSPFESNNSISQAIVETARHFPQCKWKCDLSQPSARLMTTENRKPVMQSPVPESWLL